MNARREDGAEQVLAKVRDLVVGALGRAGAGRVSLQYETYKSGVYRVIIRGTTTWRFYVTREQVARRQAALHMKDGGDGLDEVMTYIESTMLDALATTGFGEFLVEYTSDGLGSYFVTIVGTERSSFCITAHEMRGPA